MKKEAHDDLRRLVSTSFSLRRLMAAVAATGVFLAAVRYLGLYSVLLLVVGVLVVLAHLAAASIGSRLRQIGNNASDHPDDPLIGHRPKSVRPSVRYAPTTKLRHRQPLGIPILVTTASGTLVGGVLPWLLCRQGLLAPSMKSELWAGCLAFALLGGIASFLTSSFFWVLLSAWRQALRESSAK